jgi:putative CocE/NonD family hydrolase
MRIACAQLVALFACPILNAAEVSAPVSGIKLQSNVKVLMRDGIHLAADIYRPAGPGKFPCLMMLSPYWKQRPADVDSAVYYAKKGYAVTLLDSRGRHDSEGVWVPYIHEPQDGFDAQQWLGQQPWSNGKIGTFGSSYVGFTQVMPAVFRSPYLKAMVPAANQQTNFGFLYNDGVMQLNAVFTFGLFCSGRTQQYRTGSGIETNPLFNYDEIFRRLPLITALDDIADLPHVKAWIEHNTYDDYWKSYGIKEKYGEIDVPAYFISGWYDNLVHEVFRNFKGFTEHARSERARNGTKILIGPWTHALASTNPADHAGWAVDFGHAGAVNLLDLHLRWYDFWLKEQQNGIDREAPVRIFVMGANQWRQEKEWPLARTRYMKYFLASGGKANSLYGDGALSASISDPKQSDSFTFDPADPVPTLGGQISTHVDLRGPRDRRPVERRDDVLVYTSEPLTKDLEVTGPIVVKLYAASSAVDTDFTGTLTDVSPNGEAVHLCEGVRRASFRESLEHPSPIEPGKIYEYSIDLWETSNVFKAGHRMRLEISSSNFPRWARNLNTGRHFGTTSEMKTARQTIYHDAAHPSHLLLPVIPE